MFKYCMEIVHNHDNGYLGWLFHQNGYPLKESTSIMSGSGKGFTLEEIFGSPFSDQVFLSIQLQTFSKFSGWTFKFFLLLNCISLFHILMIKSSYRLPRSLQFLFQFF